MSNLPNSKGEWRFQIRKVPNGKSTDFLFNHISQADVIEIDAPYGMAYVRDNARNIVCVAGGSGLAPMVSIARGASEQGLLKDKTLHFSMAVEAIEMWVLNRKFLICLNLVRKSSSTQWSLICRRIT